MLQVVSADCCQSVFQSEAPLVVGLGETEHLRAKPEVAQHRPEGPARVDRIEEPLPHLSG